jgi:hypothetical protein
MPSSFIKSTIDVRQFNFWLLSDASRVRIASTSTSEIGVGAAGAPAGAVAAASGAAAVDSGLGDFPRMRSHKRAKIPMIPPIQELLLRVLAASIVDECMHSGITFDVR